MKTHPIKLLLLLFLLFVVIYSCEKNDSIIKQEKGLKTVAFEDAQNFIKQIEQGKNKTSGENFITSFSEDISYEDLTNTEEELAVIHVTTIYENLYSRIALLEISGEVQSVVVSLNPFEDSTPNSFSGEMLITDVGGAFLRAFRIEKNVFVSEYIRKNHSKSYDSSQTNFFYSKAGSYKTECDEDLDPNSTFCNNVIEVFITNDVSDTPPVPYVSISYIYTTDGGGEDTSEWDLGSSGGGYVDLDPDSENDKPCPGDPVNNPEIAEQEVSGLEGGRYGCTRTGGVCNNSQEGKDHGGTDILNDYGEPVYAMFDGHATSVETYYPGAGWIAYQTATVNGVQISIQYFHLQETDRVTGSVKAGDIIGYQGDSGNLAGAIASGSVESHVHIKIKDNNGNTLDPEDFMSSNPTSSINNCN